MKIAYVCYWNAFFRDGVVAKVSMQVRIWRSLGHDVAVFCVTPSPSNSQPPALDAHLFPFSQLRLRSRIAAARSMIHATRSFAPDVVYVRYDKFVPPLGRLLRTFPSALEVNGNAHDVVWEGGLAAVVYARLNRDISFRSADGLICVSQEIADGLRSFGKRTTVIANGIDLSDRRVFDAPRNERPNLVFLAGAEVKWHGAAKIAELARRMPEADFVMVGVRPEQLEGPVPPNVMLHPLLPRKCYEPLLARADVALGSLAMDRAKLAEASPLKVREYLAYGLPVILGFEDTDFRATEPWFLLRLPNTEDNVVSNVERIRSYVASVRGRRVMREEVAHAIDAQAKERRRLAFLAECVKRQPPARRRLSRVPKSLRASR